MNILQRRFPKIIVALVALLLATQEICFAGGGSGGSKASFAVRIKNNLSSTTTPPTTTNATVKIGDAGNVALVVGMSSRGQVANEFRMARYEVTVKQYTDFLNAVATRPDVYSFGPTVIESLYDERMASDANIAGIARSGQGIEGSPYSYTVVGDGNLPVTYVNWFNAARFANWMHNGAVSNGEIEFGAYLLYGTTVNIPSRSDDAKWWIPSDNEWFKAAYYKGGSSDAGYYKYPTKSDTLPGNSSDSAANQANFLLGGVFAATQSSTLSSTENYLTPVGSFTSSRSAYGTYDQGGNVEEWTDTAMLVESMPALITRGGSWNSEGLNNDVDPVSTASPSDRSQKIGFRLARTSTSEESPTLSGTVEIAIGQSTKSLNANGVAQFTVKKGSFTVTVTDVEDPSLTATATFATGGSRTTYVIVNNSGGQISVTRTSSKF
jgi:formylglycine-generating enzyme required for sulfatase activity